MNQKTTLLTVVIATILLLAVVVIALNAPDKKTVTDETVTQPTETTQQPETNTQPTTDEEQQAAATIIYTNGGFEPSTTTVKSGDTIRIENKSSMPLSFNSDDHPSHTDQSQLNVGDVPRGGSREFTVTEAGTWGFHNHENATHTGQIIVE